ncbi:MAG: hypothetical protein ABW185_27805 [Sedimenticola sp.]
MSVNKLNKFLTKNPENPPEGIHKKRLIIVSDSKGCKLQNQSQSSLENEIIWYSKPGRNSSEAKYLIKRNINDWVSNHGKIVLCIWTGTCDLTVKRGKYIDIEDARSVEQVLTDYTDIIQSVRSHGINVKVIFLEIPQYSIINWNRSRGHPNPDSYKENSDILVDRINRINDKIRDLNLELNSQSPQIGSDLYATHKRNRTTRRVNYNYNLLTDGIHPGGTLIRYWLRNFVLKLLIRNCY